jgi:protein TonB
MTTRKRGLLACLVATGIACGKSSDGKSGSFQTVGRQPDIAPVMLNKELPFRYPPALFAQKVQGNVTLRIYIDRSGLIVPESTHVAETSGFNALDSAAVKGSRELKFEPAKTQGQPVPVSILLPVFFRYPGAPPLPGDSVLTGRQSVSSTAPGLIPPPPARADTAPTKAVVKKATKPSSTRKRATTTRRKRR